MQLKQRDVDKMWNAVNAGWDEMNILHEQMNTAFTDEERDLI